MAHIDRIKVGNDTHLIEPILYVTPSLSESAYSVTLNNFELVTGVAIQAKFTVTNPANATLNVSSSGNKAIHYNGAAITGGLIKVNHIYTLIYDGSVWCITGDISEAAKPQLRTYRSNTNVQLPLVGLNAVANIISNYNTTTSITSGSYGNMYGAIPENAAKLATINPSTGAITVPGGIIGNLTGTVNGYTINANVPSGAVFTDTHRPISIGGTQILGNNITTLDLIAGSHISLTNNGGAVTIANTMTAADLGLSSAMHFIGISSTNITDGGDEAPTISNLDNYTPVNGDVVLYGDDEFVWANSIWRALGSSSSFLTGYISYGKIIVGNDSSTTGYVQAINGNESLTIRASNDWIVLTATNSSTTDEDEIKIAHSSSGVTAGSYGNSSDQEPEASDTFNVPYITVDTAGHITAAANYTVKIPLQDKVKQTGVTTSSDFPILFKNSANTDDETNEVKFGKATNKDITVNPSTGTITASIFAGNATTATSWAAEQTVYVDLESSGTDSILTGGQSIAQVLKVNGTLPIGNGGTGTSTAPTQYGVIYGNSNNNIPYYASTAAGNTGNVFIAQTNGAPIWYTGLSLESTTSNNVTSYSANFSGTVSITGAATLTGNVGIGTDPDNNYKLTINGSTKIVYVSNSTTNCIACIDLDISGTNPTVNLYPFTTNMGTLGLPNTSTNSSQDNSHRWAGLYIGTADTYGDAYTPVYWNNGVPCAVPPVQYIEWTIAEDTTGITLHNPAFSSSTYVLQLVITSGEENLKDNLTWSTSSGELTLSANKQVTDDVTGYAIVARGEPLTNIINN